MDDSAGWARETALEVARLFALPAFALDANQPGSSMTYGNVVDRRRDLLEALRQRREDEHAAEPGYAKTKVRDTLSRFFHQHTKRRLGKQRGAKVAQIEVARRLTVPLLVLHGSQDGNVAADPNFAAWKTVLAGKDATFHLYPEDNHFLLTKDDLSLDQHVDGRVIHDMVAWLQRWP